MPTADIGGWQINYTDTGSGYPVLFIHGGFGGTSVALAPPIREAVDQVRLIEYDRRNCGRSEIRDEVYTQDDLGDEAAALLAYLGVDEAVIVGSSMGGTIAQTLALRHPGRIAALALVNTSAHMKDAPFYAPIAEMVELASREGSDAVFERRRESIYNIQLPNVRHPGATEADRGEVHARVDAQFKVIRETPEEELKAFALGELCNWRAHLTFDTSEDLGRLAEHRVLVIHGDSDSIVPTEHGVELAEGIPGAELVLVPGGDHGILRWPRAREALRSWVHQRSDDQT